ncbi:unnamed protein product [Caenorhabditis brenneri]
MERNNENPVRNQQVNPQVQNEERVHDRHYMTQRIAEFARRDPRILDMIKHAYNDSEQRRREAEEGAKAPAKAA